jgi:hypothetical protein
LNYCCAQRSNPIHKSQVVNMRRPYFLTLLASILFFLSSCGSDDGFTIDAVPTAFIVVVNAIPDSPELSITSRGSLLGRIQFGQASSILTVLPQIDVPFSADFLDADGNARTLIIATENIAIGNTRIVVYGGTMAEPKVTRIASLSTDLSATESRVVLLNASNAAPNVNVTITDPNANSQTINLPVDVTSNPIQVATGAGSRIEVRDTTSNNLLWDSGLFNFTQVTERLLLLIDYVGPGSNPVRMFSITEQVDAGLFVDEQLESQIRFVNMTADRGALDVLADGNAIASGLNFGDITSYLNTPNGLTNYAVTTSGDSNDILSSASRSILPGTFYTLGAAGLDTVNSTAFTVNDRRRVTTRTSLNITRLSPSSGLLDVYLLERGGDVSGFPVLQSLADFTSVTVDLLPNEFDLVLTAPGQTTPLFGPEPLSLSANGIYSLIITDTEGGGEPVRVQFFDDFLN